MNRHLNLLPWNVRWRGLMRARLRYWCFAWGIIAICVHGWGWWEWHRLATADREFEVWQRRSEPVRNVVSFNEELRRKIGQPKARLAKYGHFENERLGIQLLAVVSQSAAVCNGKLQVLKLNFKTSQEIQMGTTKTEPKLNPPPPATRTVHLLSLSGIASTNLTVAQFVAALRDTTAFKNVELKSSQGKSEVASGPRSYQIECGF